MKQPLVIGIVGGMSPESTITYYSHIVRRHRAELNNHGYPRIIIASVSFQHYIDWQHNGEWDRIARGLEQECRAVAEAGAEFALLATNTMHKVLPMIESPIPMLSILDAVGDHAAKEGVKRVGLTGTRFTMSDPFYAEGLQRRGLAVVLPAASEQDTIHRIIYDELISGQVNRASVEEFADIADNLSARGAEAILLGCTELELLTRDGSVRQRILDSTRIHADAAWEAAMKPGAAAMI
jgi:aspartate racemase